MENRFVYEAIRNSDDLVFETPNLERTCRYCGMERPKVTFNTKAHIIPEFLGKNGRVDPLECDTCNTKFSKFENSLKVLFQPNLTLVGVKGKRGVSTFQGLAENGKKRPKISNKNGGPKIEAFDSGILQFSENSNSLKVNTKEAYNPLHAYKAFVKIGFGLMTLEEMDQFVWLEDWLVNGNDIMFPYFTLVQKTCLGNKAFNEPFAVLLKSRFLRKKNSQVPEYSVIVAAGNLCFQAYLPPTQNILDDKKDDDGLLLNVFPCGLWAKDLKPDVEYTYRFELIDLSSPEKSIHENSLDFKFGKRISASQRSADDEVDSMQ